MFVLTNDAGETVSTHDTLTGAVIAQDVENRALANVGFAPDTSIFYVENDRRFLLTVEEY